MRALFDSCDGYKEDDEERYPLAEYAKFYDVMAASMDMKMTMWKYISPTTNFEFHSSITFWILSTLERPEWKRNDIR